jgi:hypothetical protein
MFMVKGGHVLFFPLRVDSSESLKMADISLRDFLLALALFSASRKRRSRRAIPMMMVLGSLGKSIELTWPSNSYFFASPGSLRSVSIYRSSLLLIVRLHIFRGC